MSHVPQLDQAKIDGSFAYAEIWTKGHSVKEARYGEQRQEIREAFEAGFKAGCTHATDFVCRPPLGSAPSTPHRAKGKGRQARTKNPG